ncbi:EamA family transporter RarD [Pelagibacterium limicola]|uniref:EamA family transporter RarD n=1 Tax=Pelagibacterium limicola TaxID=2791022 RepID=UPI0018AF9BFA|nr:EamA family transporter RarD [Pelagibacterium limicola]
MTSIEGAPAAAGTGSPRAGGPEQDVRMGVITALSAYTLWGFLPIFFKLIEHVDPFAIVAYRIVFSLVFVGIVLAVGGRMGEVLTALRDRQVLVRLTLSALLVAVNWLTFIWAVTNERILDTSFGYFINPMVSVLIGLVLLGEKLSRLQWLAILLAVLAIGIQAVGLGSVPWVAIVLALTFAFYGYVRKTVNVGSSPGLMVETVILLPASLIFIAFTLSGPMPGYLLDPQTLLLLALTGPATAIPLMLFAFAARQLRLSTIGMFQYIAPSMGFATAILLFGEPLQTPRLISFALIWVSLVIFSVGSFRNRGVKPR